MPVPYNVRNYSKAVKAAVALAVLLAACATAQDAPARSTTTADGHDWHTWVTDSYAQPQSSVGVGLGGFRIGGGGGVGMGVGMGVPVGSPEPPARCERTLVFDNGRVIDQSWAGPPSMCADLKHP